MALVKGGGDRGNFLKISFIPDSTFKTEIDALILAGTQVTGKLFSLTWAAAYQVTSPAEDAIPDGKITDYEVTASSYRLTGILFSYIDQNAARHTPSMIINLPYTGTLALQDSVICYDGNYLSVDDGTTGGWGAVIAVDVPGSGYADILM